MSDYMDNGANNQPNDFQSPEDFVSGLNGGNDLGKFEVPDEIAGIESTAFLGGLSQISQDKIKSFDDLSSLMNATSELEDLRNSYSSLEQKYKSIENPWANDFVKELNNLYMSGDVTKEQIDHYIKMQNLDLDSMSAERILMLQKSQRFPGMTQDKVEAAFNEEFGNPEEWSEGHRALMEQKAYEAKLELSKMKKDSARPSGLIAKEERERQFQDKVNYWSKVESAVEVPNSFKINNKLSGDVNFEFDFPLPEGALDSLRQARLNYLTQNVKQGDREGYGNIEKFSRSYLYAHFGDEIMKAALEHATASTSLKKDREHHNVQSTPRGTDKKNPQINDATKAHLERIRKQGLGE